jgi:hypothetical protein
MEPGHHLSAMMMNTDLRHLEPLSHESTALMLSGAMLYPLVGAFSITFSDFVRISACESQLSTVCSRGVTIRGRFLMGSEIENQIDRRLT